MKKSHINNLFKSSGSFIDAEPNLYDALIVDEAHMLNDKSGMFRNIGENQIKELIEASKVTVFFIDEDQRIHIHDIGEKEEIRKWAKRAGAEVIETELASQFRCNGSDGYLAWLDHSLQIRETANADLREIDYDFQVMSSPVTFIDYHILRINYCRNDTDMEKSIDGIIPDPEMEVRVNPDNKNEFVVKLSSKILPGKEGSDVNCPVELEFEAIGFFEIEGDIDQEERDFHFGVSAPSMLYGVIRTWISQITAHSGYHSIMMPSVQFADLGKDDSKEREGSGVN